MKEHLSAWEREHFDHWSQEMHLLITNALSTIKNRQSYLWIKTLRALNRQGSQALEHVGDDLKYRAEILCLVHCADHILEYFSTKA